MTADAIAQVDDSRPFDYRTELKPEQIEAMQAALVALENTPSMGATAYMRHAARIRYIGIPVPAPAAVMQKRIRDRLVPGNIEIVFESEALIDPPMLRAAGIEKAVLENMVNTIRKQETPHWHELATLRVLSPHEPPHPASAKMLKILKGEKLSTMNADSSLLPTLENFTYARICGLVPREILTVEDWRSVRAAFRKLTDDMPRMLARMAFAARIMAAEDVYVDEDGLQIVDPSPVSSAVKQDVPPPLRKHI